MVFYRFLLLCMPCSRPLTFVHAIMSELLRFVEDICTILVIKYCSRYELFEARRMFCGIHYGQQQTGTGSNKYVQTKTQFYFKAEIYTFILL